MKVCSVAEMRAMDRKAIEQFGIPEEILMENAGLAAFQVLKTHVGIRNKKFIIFCAIGNNGGDGFVVARKIHSNGGAVKVLVLGNPEKYQGAAKTNYQIAVNLELDIERVQTVDAIRTDTLHCDGIIDAIFGTGLARNVEGFYREVINLINSSGKPVLSLDIPSGSHGDTGQVMGISVKADYTVTFGLPKIGNLLYPGYQHGGRLFITHISFPPSLYDADDVKIAVNRPICLPPRNTDGHKGDFGDVLFIAGAAGYIGAPYFAAFSFLKAGGGYSRLAAPVSITPVIASRGSEIVFAPQKETPVGSIAFENKEDLLALSSKTDMVVMGPGLSLEADTQNLVRTLTEEIDKPVLLDGDGITALTSDINIVSRRKAETILTPHLGEMARITNTSVDDIKANRIDILQQTAARLNAIIVLKGAHSLIGYPDGKVFINLTGNSGMATAGSGDVLTGAIAAMLGLGLTLPEAVRQGVYIHGQAGDLAADQTGEDGISARDIMEALPAAMRNQRIDPVENPIRSPADLEVI
jgi:NAD(P)H-hydrate epimerase